MKIYVASSWRNPYQPLVVREIREQGYEVYDFRHPAPGDDGFSWADIAPDWQSWDNETFRVALNHPIAEASFASDFKALQECEVCVLVLPCGRSAHLEAGITIGAGKPTIILMLDQNEPELMYKATPFVCVQMCEVLECLRYLAGAPREEP